MKKMALLTFFLAFVTFTPAALAQSSNRLRAATPSGSISPTRTIAQEANELKDKIATDVAAIKSKKSHIVGKITSLTTNTVTILSSSGQQVVVTVDTTTKVFELTGPKKTLNFSDLKVGNQIAVVGISPTERSGIATFIYRLPDPVRHQALFGTITKVETATSAAKVSTGSASLATVTVSLKIGTNAQVIITKDTKLNIPGVSKPTIKDLKAGQKIVTTGVIDTTRGFLATKLIVIGTGTLTPTPSIATSSATEATGSTKTKTITNPNDLFRKTATPVP